MVGLEEAELGTIQRSMTSQRGMKIIGQGLDGYDALHLVETLKPDIALLDEKLSLLNVADATVSLKRISPQTKVVILTSSCENELVLRAIINGAAGYLIKQWDLLRIHWRIQIVHFGYSLMSPEITALAYQRFFGAKKDKKPSRTQRIAGCQNLSPQEVELIFYIGQGLSNEEIAKTLNLKNGTIRNYLTSIYQKIGLRNRTQVAIYAHHNGLISSGGVITVPPFSVGASRRGY